MSTESVPHVSGRPIHARRLAERIRSGQGACTAGLLVAFVVFLTAWALASPVGATPDENYHMVTIWCNQGTRDSACRVSDSGKISVPKVLPIKICYAFESKTSAGCQLSGPIADNTHFVETTLGDFGEHAGDYPPVFYAVMSLLVGPDIEQSILNMRLLNVGIFTAMLTILYVASTSKVRRALVATTAVLIVPLGAFLVASINPSGWTIASAFTLLFAIFGYVRAREPSRIVVLGLVSVFSFILGAGSRADGSIYAAIAIICGSLLGLHVRQSVKSALLRLALPFALVVIAAFTFLQIGSSAVYAPPAESSWWQTVLIFFDIFRYIPGALGMFEMGWGDTIQPSIVWVSTCLACAGVVFVGFAAMGRRRLLTFGLAVGSMLFIPTYIASTSWTPGASLQARYVFPLIIMVVAVATLGTEQRRFWLTPSQRWLVVVAVSIANAVAIYTNLRRYVTGTDVERFRLAPGEWWWSGAVVSSEVVCLLGAVALPIALILATTVLVEPRSLARLSAGEPGEADLDFAPTSSAVTEEGQSPRPRHAQASRSS